MKTAIELWRYISRHGLKPIPKMTVSAWADKYRMLSSGISAEPGKWKTSRAPYQKEIMDAFTQPNVKRVIVKSCSQVGKSDMMNNVVGRFAHLDPATIMLIEPTVDAATDYSKSRIAPMIRDTKVLTPIFHDLKDGRGNPNTILSKIFPGGRLIMCGANSPAGLASRPIRILLADEVDRFPVSAGTEGDPVDLAAKRTTTFWNAVIGMFSTPTNEGASRIEIEYLSGTQEEWQHECPNCGEYHLLRYTDMAVDYDGEGKNIIIHSVKWRCPDCGFEFTEAQMKRTKKKYVAQNERALENGIRSFHVNCFASPWLSWKEVMKEWLMAKGKPDRERVVMNTRFGETYRMPGAFEDETIFLRRREKYGAELPDGVLMLTASVDTQDNRLEYEVCGWGRDEESWGIVKGVILGEPDKSRTWQELDEVLDHVYTFADGSGLKVLRTFIDSGGHYTSDVYAYCTANFNKQRFAIKGQGGPGIPLNYKIGRASGSKIPLCMLGVDDGKQSVMNRLAVEVRGAQYCHFPKDESDLPNMPHRGYDDLYFKGIISEHKKVVKRGGQIREVWEPTQGVRNEPLDLRVYNLACMQSCRPNWDRLESLLTGVDSPEEKPVVKAKLRTRLRVQQNIW